MKTKFTFLSAKSGNEIKKNMKRNGSNCETVSQFIIIYKLYQFVESRSSLGYLKGMSVYEYSLDEIALRKELSHDMYS